MKGTLLLKWSFSSQLKFSLTSASKNELLTGSFSRFGATRGVRAKTNMAAIQSDSTKMAAFEKDDKMAYERHDGGHTGAVEGLRKRVSYLYVPGNLHHKCASLLIPYMDLDSKFADLPQLAAELELRGVASQFGGLGGLRELERYWREFCLVRERIEKEEDVESNPGRKSQRKTDVTTEEEPITTCVEQRTKVKSRLHELESTIVPVLLDLPNCLRKSPYDPGEVVVSKLPHPVFAFPPKPHTQLRTPTTDSIELLNVSPGAFYSSGDIAECEMLLEQYWSSTLDRLGYLRQCNPDFVKGAVVEGCGYHPQQKLKVVGDASDAFLVGGASLPAYLGYFARRAVKKTEKFLPQKLFSCQRVYVPLNNISTPNDAAPSECCPQNSDLREGKSTKFTQNGDDWPISDRSEGRCESSPAYRGVFASMQSTSVSLLVATTKESPSEDETVSEVLGVVTKAYEKLGLHFRIVRCRCEGLRRYEKDALSVQMLTTSRVGHLCTNETSHSSENKMYYVEVGRISVIGDYISKRLLMMYVKDEAPGDTTSPSDGRRGTAPKHGFLNLVFAELMSVSKFVAVALENLQDKNGVSCVKEFLETAVSSQEK